MHKLQLFVAESNNRPVLRKLCKFKEHFALLQVSHRFDNTLLVLLAGIDENWKEMKRILSAYARVSTNTVDQNQTKCDLRAVVAWKVPFESK